MRAQTVLAIAVVVLSGSSAPAQAKGTIKVSFLSGKAETTPAGQSTAKALALGSECSEGDTIETREGAKLELLLGDGSKLRLAPNTKVTLSEGRFGDKGERNVSVSMWFGRLWAKVAKSVGGDDTFEVGTRNAVAGVRGTAFAVQAAEDLSAIVRVYAGTVGVRKGEGEAFRAPHSKKQVPPPSRVDRKQWEEIIAGAMKQVKITSAGDISPAHDFEDTGEELKWAMWNQERDKKEVMR